MRTLPTTMIQVLAPFAPLFSERVLAACQLLAGRCDPRSGQEDRSLRPQSGGPGGREDASAATIGS